MEKKVQYNDFKNWPKGLQEKLRIRDEDMPQGRDVVEFQLLRAPITVSNIKNDKSSRWPASVVLVNQDIVYDEKGTEYPVAYIQSVNADGSPNFGMVEFKGQDGGAIMFTAKDANRFGLLRYLRCMNQNKTNLLKSDNKVSVFKELEPVKSAREQMRIDKEIMEVKLSIHELSNAEAVTYLKSLKKPHYEEQERNINALLEYVKDPVGIKKYMSLSTDIRLPLIGMVNEARVKGVVLFSEDENTWTYGSTGRRVCPPITPGSEPVEYLVDFMHNDKEGKAVLNYIKAQIEGEKADENRKETEEEVLQD